MEEGKIVFAKESYNLVKAAYDIFNQLKFGYHEKYYQRAYEIELGKMGYKFIKEYKVDINYQSKNIGRYYFDFLVQDKIVVEFKVGSEFFTNHLKQVLSYLKSANKRLGIIFLFTPTGVKYKRLVN